MFGRLGRRGWAGWAGALVALLLLALARTAGAHTRLESSSPAAGDTVTAGVTEVRIRFTQAVEGRFTRITVLQNGVALEADSVLPVPDAEGRAFVLPLAGGLRPGSYRVEWRTAGADGHVITGSFSFVVVPDPADTVAAAAPLPPPPPPDPGAERPRRVPGSLDAAAPLPVAVRWAGFLALLGMIGAPAFVLGVADRLRRAGTHALAAERSVLGAWYVALAAAALSVVTLVARLWAQSAALNGSGEALERANLDALLGGTVWGVAWLLQALATVAFSVGLFVSRAPHGRGVGWMGAGVGAVLLAWVPALSGHAAAVEPLQAVAIVADTAHVLGAGVWLGTLAVLLAAGLPSVRAEPDGGGPALAAMVNAFSPLALFGAGVAGATGVANALFHITAPADLWRTGYGLALLLKVMMLAVVAGLGWYNWRVVRPTLGTAAAGARLRRSAATEVAFGAAVVLVTAILVALPTP